MRGPKGQRNRMSCLVGPPWRTCPNCGRKVETKWAVTAATTFNFDHRKVVRVKIDGSNGNGKSKATSLRELEKTSIIV